MSTTTETTQITRSWHQGAARIGDEALVRLDAPGNGLSVRAWDGEEFGDDGLPTRVDLTVFDADRVQAFWSTHSDGSEAVTIWISGVRAKLTTFGDITPADLISALQDAIEVHDAR